MTDRTDRRGALYALEGPDDVGKSTIANLTVQQLQAAGVPCLALAFPGNNPGSLGGLVYNIHHAPETYHITDLHPMGLQLLHVAAHIDAIERLITPAVAAGRVVVLDRFWWSTWVYGQYADLDSETIEMMIALEKRFWGDLLPSAVFLVHRAVPEQDDPISGRSQLESLYNTLARREEASYRVVDVVNDGDVMDPVTLISNLIREDELTRQAGPSNYRSQNNYD